MASTRGSRRGRGGRGSKGRAPLRGSDTEVVGNSTPRKPWMLRGQGAAERAHVSYSTWRRWDRQERIPRSRQIGGCIRWFEPEILAWMAHDCPVRDEWEPLWRRIRMEWVGGAS